MGSLPNGIAVEIEAIFEVEGEFAETLSQPAASIGTEEQLEKSEGKVTALEARVEELEEFVDTLVEEIQNRFEAIAAKL